MIRCIILVLMLLFTNALYAQTELDNLFNKAQQLNLKREYLAAARLFAQVQEKALEQENIERYVASITAEGECYYMLDLSLEMEGVLKRAKEAYDKFSNNIDRVNSLLLLESIYKLEGSYYYCLSYSDPTAYSKAETAYMNCIDVLNTIKKESHIDDKELEINVHRELLSLYYKQEQYDKAIKEADIVYQHRRDIGFDSDNTSIEAKRDYDNFVDAYVSRAIVLARLNRFDDAMKILEDMPDICNEDAALLRSKGKIIMLQYASEGVDNRNLAKEYYIGYINKLKKEFEKQFPTLTNTQREQYWLSIHNFLFDCYCLEEYAPDLLYDLALFSKGYLLEYNLNTHSPEIKWTNIREVLKQDECAIEFVQYNNEQNEEQIAALIVRNNYTSPRFVNLGSVKGITTAILQNGQSVETAISNNVGVSKDALYTDSTLINKIWNEEIQKSISDCSNIYFSADGFIHQLAIEYLYPDSTKNLYRLSSTRLLTTPKEDKFNGILLCGGIDFYADVQPQKADNDILGYNGFQDKSISITRLKGTEIEVDSIYQLNKTKANTLLIKGDSATDDNFTHLAQDSYSIIHLATHGYFLGNNNFTDLKPALRDHSMSESGLMMAGAGKNLNNKEFNPLYSDGILTAKEISALNLSNVDLIVLSACQTGLGYITADGVYGTQRALKIAGVDAMIVSLWDVDDNATTKFMSIFYEELNKGSLNKVNVYQAFKTARERILANDKFSFVKFSPKSLTSKRSDKPINLPRYANAFILIDGI